MPCGGGSAPGHPGPAGSSSLVRARPGTLEAPTGFRDSAKAIGGPRHRQSRRSSGRQCSTWRPRSYPLRPEGSLRHQRPRLHRCPHRHSRSALELEGGRGQAGQAARITALDLQVAGGHGGTCNRDRTWTSRNPASPQPLQRQEMNHACRTQEEQEGSVAEVLVAG